MKNRALESAIAEAIATAPEGFPVSALRPGGTWFGRFMGAVLAQNPHLLTELVTTSDAAELLDRAPSTISAWKTPGHIAPAGKIGNWPAYRVSDLVRVEAEVRARAIGPNRRA